MAGQNDTVTSTKGFSSALVGRSAAKNRLSNRPGYSPLQRVFGIGHRLPADLTSDDVYAPDPEGDLAATDASLEESRQIREAAMKAHAEVSIRDRVEDSFRARPRTQTVLRPDDVIMVWNARSALSIQNEQFQAAVREHQRRARDAVNKAVRESSEKRINGSRDSNSATSS